MEFDPGLFSTQGPPNTSGYHQGFHHHHQEAPRAGPQAQQQQQQQQHHPTNNLHHAAQGLASAHVVSSPEDNLPANGVKKSRSSGRPRDRIWEMFKGEKTATCVFCDWSTEHPKAVRLRQHIIESCDHVPLDKKQLVQTWEDMKAHKKAVKKTSLGGAGAGGSSGVKREKEPLIDDPSAAIRAHQSGHGLGGAESSGSKKRRAEDEPQQQESEMVVDPGLDGFNALDNALTQTMSNLHRSPVTCHVLDSTAGKPAPGIAVKLEKLNPSAGFVVQATGATDADGRCSNLLPAHPCLDAGVYKMTFYTSDYFRARGISTFYPFVEIPFSIANPEEHHHIPLLLAPFAYSTYRGS